MPDRTPAAPAPQERVLTSRWITLLVMTRLLAAGVAVLLLVVHRATGHDGLLAAVVIAYTAASLTALYRVPRLQLSAAVVESERQRIAWDVHDSASSASTPRTSC